MLIPFLIFYKEHVKINNYKIIKKYRFNVKKVTFLKRNVSILELNVYNFGTWVESCRK